MRRVAALGGALLLVAGGALWIATRGGGPAESRRPRSNAGSDSLPPSLRGGRGAPLLGGGRGDFRVPGSPLGGIVGLPGGGIVKAPPSRIVFMKGSGHGDIYEMNEDGSRQNARVTDPGHDCGPAYSPDGRYLMFSSQTSSGTATSSTAAVGSAALPWYPLNFDLYLLDLERGTRRQVTTNPGVDFTPAWSPDGRRIAFARGGLGELTSIWVMNADGTGLRQLTQASGSTFHWVPDWSPDGTRIVYMSSDLADLAHPSVRMVDARGTNDRILVADGGFPAWSPDGRSIAFASSRGQLPGEYDVYVMDGDGSGQRRLQHQDGAEFFPHWSPDGSSIVYAQDPDGWVFEVHMLLPGGAHTLDVQLGRPALSSIWRMRSDGSNPVQLTEPNGEPNGDLFPVYVPVSTR